MLSVNPYIFSSSKFEELTSKYISALKASTPENQNGATKIEEYFHKEGRQFLKDVEKIKNQIGKIIAEISPVSFTISGRKKAFKSYADKVCNASPKVDKVRDTYAFRTVLSANSLPRENVVDFCFVVAKAIATFVIKSDRFILVPLTTKSDGLLSPETLEKIYIPDESSYSPLIHGYEMYIKNYIGFPKAKGYQSIHLLIRDSHTGRYFEFQIRDSTMHMFAEIGDANHDDYKPDQTDYSKLKIEGISVDNGKIIKDEHGLIKPLPIGDPFVFEHSNDEINWLHIL